MVPVSSISVRFMAFPPRWLEIAEPAAVLLGFGEHVRGRFGASLVVEHQGDETAQQAAFIRLAEGARLEWRDEEDPLQGEALPVAPPDLLAEKLRLVVGERRRPEAQALLT